MYINMWSSYTKERKSMTTSKKKNKQEIEINNDTSSLKYQIEQKEVTQAKFKFIILLYNKNNNK